MLYGDQSSWTFSNRAYYAWRKTLKAVNDILEPHQKRLAHEEMLSHEILTPDLLVQRTHFSSGVEVRRSTTGNSRSNWRTAPS